MRIIIGHSAQGCKQLPVVKAIGARVDFLHESLFRRTILLLHNALNLSVSAADHTPVSGRLRQLRSQHSCCRSGLAVHLNHPAERLLQNQRGIAADHNRNAFLLSQQRRSLKNRMAGALLLSLNHKFRPVAQIRLHRFAAVADYHHIAGSAKPFYSIQDMAHHRLAANGVKHLVQLRFHSFALACRQDNTEYVQIYHLHHKFQYEYILLSGKRKESP
ncbi:hypothetical protein D3C75_696080 [compost metagenome]